MVTITLTVPKKDLDEIRRFCKENEMKISGLFRLSAKKLMREKWKGKQPATK